MMTGMDDRDDPESDLTLEAMAGLSKILAVVDESNVRHIFINICLRIRPCFIKVCVCYCRKTFAMNKICQLAILSYLYKCVNAFHGGIAEKCKSSFLWD